MGRTLGLLYVLALTLQATPVAFNGHGQIGHNLFDLFLTGTDSGFEFSTGRVYGPTTYGGCRQYPCDLSNTYPVYSGDLFSASDGTTSANSYNVPRGVALGQVTWVPSPLQAEPPAGPNFRATVVLPMTVSGWLQAWTPEEWENHQAPFFHYSLTGHGTLTAFFEFSTPLATESAIVAVRPEFSGEATPIPEPAAWMAVPAAVLLLLLRRRSPNS